MCIIFNFQSLKYTYVLAAKIECYVIDLLLLQGLCTQKNTLNNYTANIIHKACNSYIIESHKCIAMIFGHPDIPFI